MIIRIGKLSVSCFLLLAGAALAACGDGERPRQLDRPGVLHGNGGSGGGGSMAGAGGGGSSLGGSAGDDDGLDAGTGGYQIGTDWDGDTRPTANHAQGIDAAAGEEARGSADSGDGPDGG